MYWFKERKLRCIRYYQPFSGSLSPFVLIRSQLPLRSHETHFLSDNVKSSFSPFLRFQFNLTWKFSQVKSLGVLNYIHNCQFQGMINTCWEKCFDFRNIFGNEFSSLSNLWGSIRLIRWSSFPLFKTFMTPANFASRLPQAISYIGLQQLSATKSV